MNPSSNPNFDFGVDFNMDFDPSLDFDLDSVNADWAPITMDQSYPAHFGTKNVGDFRPPAMMDESNPFDPSFDLDSANPGWASSTMDQSYLAQLTNANAGAFYSPVAPGHFAASDALDAELDRILQQHPDPYGLGLGNSDIGFR